MKNIKLITSMIKIANKLDEIGFFGEANKLTRIADDLSKEKSEIPQEIEDFIENNEENFAKLFEIRGPSGYEYIIVSKIDGKISIGNPTTSRYLAERDFDRLKTYLWDKKTKFKVHDLPPTKEQLRKFEKYLQRGERQMKWRGDWEGKRRF